MANRAPSNHGVDRSDENRPSGSGMYRQTESSIIISVGSPSRFGGIKGALRIPFLSFQFLRRPGRTAKLLCFHTAGGFESHRLHQIKIPKNLPLKITNCCRALLPDWANFAVGS